MAIVKVIHVPNVVVPRKEQYPSFSFCRVKDKGHPVEWYPVERPIEKHGNLYNAFLAQAALEVVEPGTDEAQQIYTLLEEIYEHHIGKTRTDPRMGLFSRRTPTMLRIARDWSDLPGQNKVTTEDTGQAQSHWQSRTPARIKVPNKPKLEINPSYTLSDFQRRHIQNVLNGIGFDVSFKGVKDES